MFPDEKNKPKMILYGNVPEAVTGALREMILSGQLAPGTKVSQDEIAEHLAVSTMPVREALRGLQAEGLIVYQPRQGAHVRQLSLAEFEEVFLIREQLEVLAIRWAAEDFDRFPLTKLRRLLDELIEIESQGDVQRRLLCVRDFYFSIFSVSNKPTLLRLLSNLWDLSVHYLREYSEIEEIMAVRVEQIRSVYEACEAQDLDALISRWHKGYALINSILSPRLEKEENEDET